MCGRPGPCTPAPYFELRPSAATGPAQRETTPARPSAPGEVTVAMSVSAGVTGSARLESSARARPQSPSEAGRGAAGAASRRRPLPPIVRARLVQRLCAARTVRAVRARAGASALCASELCAQHGRDEEVKVLWGTRSQGPRANRKALTAREALKEAGNETASRRIETGYEAAPTRASGQLTAKLSRPKEGTVDPAVVRGTSRTLTWGDLASRPKGRRRKAEREVSRGRSSGREARQGWLPAYRKPRSFDGAKGQTSRRASRP